MDPQQIGIAHQRRLVRGEIEGGVGQGVGDSAQSFRTLRMAGARTVVEHVPMGVERDSHPSY